MADLLVKHLKEKTEEHSALTSLYSQWDFDQKLIPKALQTVGVLFSHYSRHDESHSKQILVNIERILGSNISLLSATDTWLILEAAYWHDIGMVVPQADMNKALKDPEFNIFLKGYCDQPHSELHHVAIALKKRRGTNAVFDESNPLEMVTRFKELMAEWFRRKHPDRADQIVKTPMQSIGVNSPRTELIPSRLFRVLGKICLMHGVPFDDLMKDDGLPFREAGLAQDDCHPRFVACMLRMGDLLDMDDNRFCPVMQRIAGDDRPNITMAHEDKHSAIRHLRIDQEKIEVSAECESIDGYLEAFKWFEWLKQEMQDQMANWRDIVPDRALGLLPTLGKISVSICGNIQILRDGERPAFGIDTHNAIELLQGNNLYDSKFACVREALQNAVDATNLRIWLENQDKQNLDWSTPFNPNISPLLNSLPINFNLKELDTTEDPEQKTTKWIITIVDSGTGISKKDLEHMLKIGGSKRNLPRQSKIDTMPEWLKPSGTFGIGLQSLFMLTEQIQIKTKSLLTNEAFNITMHSPTGAKQGLITLSSADNSFSSPFGTELSFIIELHKFSTSYNISFTREESLASIFAAKLDPILDNTFPYEAATVYDAALKFNEHSMIPICGTFKTKQKDYISTTSATANYGQEEDNDWRFFSNGDFECRFHYRPATNSHPAQSITTFYRGQEFETKGIYIPNVEIKMDILSGKASDWLKFSRDKASTKAMDRLKKVTLETLLHFVKSDLLKPKLGKERTSQIDDAMFSTFLKGMTLQFGGEWIALGGVLGDSWLDLPVKNSNRTFRSYFEQDEWSVQLTRENKIEQSEDYHLKLGGTHAELTILTMILEWNSKPPRTTLIKGNNKIYETVNNDIENELPHERAMRKMSEEDQLRNIILFKRAHQAPWDEPALATALMSVAKSRWGNQRNYISATDVSVEGVDFQALVLKDETGIRAENLFSMSLNQSARVLLPFLFLHDDQKDGTSISTESLDELCKWVQPNLMKECNLAEIKENYLNLINYIDIKVMQGTIYWSYWKKSRGI